MQPPPSPPSYRLLFLDLDGTLVGHDDLPSPRTVASIRAAHAAGCSVVVCTGRHRHSVEPIVAHWAGAPTGSADSFGVYSNGAVLVDLSTGRTLHKVVLPAEAVRHAAHVAHAHGLAPLRYGVHVEEDGGSAVYTDRRFPTSPAWAAEHGHRLRYVEAVDDTASPQPSLPSPAASCVNMGVYGSEEPTRAVVEAWRRELGPDEVVMYGGPEPRYGPDRWGGFLHGRAADKAHAARIIAEILNVPREQTLAIGDHVNDLKLLRWAGMGVCMGDGREEAKACAAHVTGTLADDGAAQAIERFVLGIGDGLTVATR